MHPGNPGATFMKTSKQVKEENLVIAGVRKIFIIWWTLTMPAGAKVNAIKRHLKGYKMPNYYEHFVYRRE